MFIYYSQNDNRRARFDQRKRRKKRKTRGQTLTLNCFLELSPATLQRRSSRRFVISDLSAPDKQSYLSLSSSPKTERKKKKKRTEVYQEAKAKAEQKHHINAPFQIPKFLAHKTPPFLVGFLFQSANKNTNSALRISLMSIAKYSYREKK